MSPRALAVLLGLTTVGLVIAAIWTAHATLAERLVASASVAFVATLIVGLFASLE